MCFRPAEAGIDGVNITKCPECGKPIQNMGGMVLKFCPFCKTDFNPYLNGEIELPADCGTSPSNSAPAAAPAAPVAPAAPAAPAAPKPPVA